MLLTIGCPVDSMCRIYVSTSENVGKRNAYMNYKDAISSVQKVRISRLALERGKCPPFNGRVHEVYLSKDNVSGNNYNSHLLNRIVKEFCPLSSEED